jgi:putative membrane protein
MQTVYSFIKGGIIGLANLIPGVSGGTMALILGIYERMINSLNSISLNLFISFIRLFSFKKSA